MNHEGALICGFTVSIIFMFFSQTVALFGFDSYWLILLIDLHYLKRGNVNGIWLDRLNQVAITWRSEYSGTRYTVTHWCDNMAAAHWAHCCKQHVWSLRRTRGKVFLIILNACHLWSSGQDDCALSQSCYDYRRKQPLWRALRSRRVGWLP